MCEIRDMNTFIVDGFYPGPECTLNRYLTHASQSVNDKKLSSDIRRQGE